MKAETAQGKTAEDAASAETYVIRRVDGPPDWESVPMLPIDRVLWTEDTGIRAWGQLCCDGEGLCVHLWAAEKEIRAENTALRSPVWEDSCLEFFFMRPGAEGYFNFEINPNGCLCLQFGRGRAGRADLTAAEAGERFRIRTQRTAEGWEVFYRIPLAFLQSRDPAFRFEGELRANLYKCGDKTPRPHVLAWSPIRSEKPDFHRPEDFGRLRFGE